MPTPINSIARTMTAIVQCRIRENIGNRRCCAMVMPLAAAGSLDCARLLPLPGAAREGCRIGRRPRAEQRIVGGRYPRGQHQRVEIDIAAVARRLALDLIDRQRADIDMLAIARPWR